MAHANGEPELSEGCIRAILNGVEPNDPRVQLLESRQVPQNRHRLLINDKRNTYSFTMLATQLNHLVENGTLAPFSILVLKKYVVNNQQNRNLLILLEVEVLIPGDQINRKLGNPISLGDNGLPAANNTANPAPAVQANVIRPTVPQQGFANRPPANGSLSFQSPAKQPARFDGGPVNKRPNFGSPAVSNTVNGRTVPVNGSFPSGGGMGSFQQQQPTMPSMGSTGMTQDDTQNIHPISALNPYNNVWMIRARVTSKDQIRFWNKPHSSGKVFSCMVTDGESEIKVSAFNNEVDRFFDIFEVGKTYFIKNGTVKNADQRYSRGRLYDLSLKADSVVEECHDDVGQVKMQYKFVPFVELLTVTGDPNIDVIGIRSSAGELFQGKAKQSGRDFVKRDLDIVDQNSTSVRITFWGSQAEKFDKDQVVNHVIAVHGCRLNEYNGTRTLSTAFDATIEVDPDIPEAHELRGWYDQGGSSFAPQALFGTSSQGSFGSTPYKSFWQVQAEGLGGGEKADWFMMRATVMKAFARDNTLYRACVNSGCNKKVTDQGNGTFRCERCNTENDSFTWRLMLSVELADCTGGDYATMFQDSAEKVLRMDAQSLGELKLQDATAFEKAISTCQFGSFVFKMKVKLENYNDELRRRFTVNSCEPVNFAAETKRLQEALAQMGIGV